MAAPTPYDYTDRDLAAIRTRLQTLAQSSFPSWTDFNQASFGNFLLEMMSWVGDLLGVYQDFQAGESRWSTAKTRRAIISLAKLIGYELSGATAAQISVTFTLSAALTEDVVIPEGTEVATLEATPTVYRTMSALTIPAGSLSGSVDVENAELWDETFETDGSPHQQVKLGRAPFLEGSVGTSGGGYVLTGLLDWTEVDNFLDSTGSDRHFLVVVDENDFAFLRFGDGVSGSAPNGTLEVRYKTGGGVVGNVEAGSIREVRATLLTVGGASVSATLTNNAGPSVLGTDRMGIEEARVEAPASLRGLNRTVTRTDFEDNALALVKGIGRVLCLTTNELAGIPENQSRVWIVPTGGGLPSPTLRAAVEEVYETLRPKTITHVVQVVAPASTSDLYASVDIVATVYLRASVSPATVRADVLAALEARFSPTGADGLPNADVNFGYYMRDADDLPEPIVRWSDIHDVIREVEGIRKLGTPADGEELTLNGVADDFAIAVYKFPALGTLTLVNGDTGIPIPEP